MTIEEKKEVLKRAKPYTKYICTWCKNTNHKQRFEVEFCDGNITKIFVYKPNSKRYGLRYDVDFFVESFDFTIPSNKDIEIEWHRRLKRAIKCLEKSGLWENILELLKNLDKMNYQDKKDISDMFWDRTDVRYIFAKYGKQYPFIFYYSNTDGSASALNVDYIFGLSECPLKSMYFGKYSNKEKKAEIAEHLANKTDYKCSARTSYDVSYCYESQKNKAWYSEEYRDCGNGHYYLALDESTALFCEDD